MNNLTTNNQVNLILAERQPIDQNPAAVYIASLGSESSRRSQKAALEIIAGMVIGSPDIFAVKWASLRFQHTQLIRNALAERYSYKTVNKTLCALRKTLKAAWRLKQMKTDDYMRAADIEGVKGESIPPGRGLASGEIAALMGACENDTTPAGARDAAIIALAYSCGLRRDEIVKLSLEDYDHITGRLVVRGKRNKERTAYLINGAAAAMVDWLAVRGDQPGGLFYAIGKGGRIMPRYMSNQAIYNMFAKRGNQAGVKHFSPHDLRRSFISDLLDNGADIAVVSKMAGHKSVVTTAGYDRRPEGQKVKAAELLHVPYHGRLIQ